MNRFSPRILPNPVPMETIVIWDDSTEYFQMSLIFEVNIVK